MLAALFLILISLWLLDYIHIEGIALPEFLLFSFNGHPVTLWSVLILVFVCWAVSITPTPLKQIIAMLLIFWILVVLGIVTITGIPLASIAILAIIVSIIIALLRPENSSV